MNRTFVVTGLLACCFFLANGYGQERPKAGSERARGEGRERSNGGARLSEGMRMRGGFSGKVVEVSPGSGTFSLLQGGNVVGFDASNPVLSGYRTLSDMRVGDLVKVSYTASGIEVTKLGGRREMLPAKEAKAESQAREARAGEKRVKGAAKLLKRPKKGNGESFEDVDLKKDGKITPVELSIVIKDLTMDQFRAYDKKHRGYLDREEFQEAMRQYRSRKAQ